MDISDYNSTDFSVEYGSNQFFKKNLAGVSSSLEWKCALNIY